MAAPTYTSDLVDIDLAETTTNWAESTNASWDDGGPPAQETEFFIQAGSTPACVSATTSVAKGNYSSMIANNGSGVTIPTDGAALIWQYYAAPNNLDIEANAGQVVIVGSSLGDFYYWTSGGSDAYPNPYGGWKNVAVNPTVTTTRGTVGSPTSTRQYFGGAVKNLAEINKGNPFGLDAIRYGRCEARFANGDLSNGYCTFAGFAAANDTASARWGLLQAIQGGYLWKGLMTLGYSTAVDFRDANVKIFIEDTKIVTAGFNAIEIRQSGSRVDWTNITFDALGATSKGTFAMIDAADVNIDSCQFTGMSTFTFLSSGDALNSIFRNCAQIVMPGGSMNGSSVLASTVAADASALVWNVATDPDGYLDNMTFSKGSNDHHAIEFGTSSPTSITLRGWTTSGFSSSNGVNSSTFYIARDSGTVTINVVDGNGNFSYKSAGATVSIVQDPVTVLVHVEDIDGNNIENARVYLQAKDATGPFPFEETVTSIVNSGTTATVTHTGHGMASNDWVKIEGASLTVNNGAFEITKISDDSYSYTLPSAPGSSPSGTIKATFIALTGLTSAAGDKSTSRVYSSLQPVTGWARLTPTYKSFPLRGSVSSTTGYSATALLIDD